MYWTIGRDRSRKDGLAPGHHQVTTHAVPPAATAPTVPSTCCCCPRTTSALRPAGLISCTAAQLQFTTPECSAVLDKPERKQPARANTSHFNAHLPFQPRTASLQAQMLPGTLRTAAHGIGKRAITSWARVRTCHRCCACGVAGCRLQRLTCLNVARPSAEENNTPAHSHNVQVRVHAAERVGAKPYYPAVHERCQIL